ncbi:MAG: O-methyltransferase [Saprospiraceae bacterium]
MDIFQEQLYRYCEAHTSPADEVLYELERETHLKTLAPQMMCGPLQGQLLYMLSKMIQAKSILEIGVFTGYASICMARGMAPDGKLYAIEVNKELEYLIRKYIKKAELESSIDLLIGDAKKIIPTLETTFDMVFIDAGKKDNEYYYELIMDRLNPGGLLLVDNVLWRGKVVSGATDTDTKAIDAFNKMVVADDRVENVLLPVRDGLIVVRKK